MAGEPLRAIVGGYPSLQGETLLMQRRFVREWYDGLRDAPRHPRERKGLAYEVTTEASGQLCGPEGCC
ncbi:MAG: hypothetical protein VX815_06385 [Gemmatimonadota bacterium]|nr:hypothetical protein [Gemmatimonadota bacterium]